MLSWKTGLAVVAAGSAFSYYALGDWSGPPVALTAVPAPAHQALDIRPERSSLFLTVPANLSGVGARSQAALPSRLPPIKSWLPDAACAKRTRWMECNTARLEGQIELDGPLKVEISGHTARMGIPLSYDLSATGIGWARGLSQRKKGSTTLWRSFEVRYDAGTGFTVAPGRVEHDPAATISILKAKVDTEALVAAHLQPAVDEMQRELTSLLAALPIKSAVAKAWSKLAAPLELEAGSGRWLKTVPEFVSPTGFVTADGRTSYRLAIVGRVSIVEKVAGEVPSSSARSRNSEPLYGVHDQAPATSRIRLAVPVGLATMQQAAVAAFRKAGTIESRADRFSRPVKAKVESVRVYPAARQIAAELQLSVTDLTGSTLRGTAHLVGRPAIDLSAGTVTLTDVTFPLSLSRERNDRRSRTGAPRLGPEPFASILASVARLDISRAASEALPRARYLLDQGIGEGLRITADLSQARAVSFELAEDGGWLLVDVEGEIAIGYEAPALLTGVRIAAPVVAAAPPAPAPAKVTSETNAPAAQNGSNAQQALSSAAVAHQAGRNATPGHEAARSEGPTEPEQAMPAARVLTAAPPPAAAGSSGPAEADPSRRSDDQAGATAAVQPAPQVKAQPRAQAAPKPRPNPQRAPGNRNWVTETFNRS